PRAERRRRISALTRYAASQSKPGSRVVIGSSVRLWSSAASSSIATSPPSLARLRSGTMGSKRNRYPLDCLAAALQQCGGIQRPLEESSGRRWSPLGRRLHFGASAKRAADGTDATPTSPAPRPRGRYQDPRG